MEYIHVQWLDSSDDEPVSFFHELDTERFTLRMIEIYRNGQMKSLLAESGFIGDAIESASVPQISEINEDSSFKAQKITSDEFEAMWKKAERS